MSYSTLIPFRRGNKWGYCNKEKELVIDCVYDFADKFYEGLSRVSLNEKWGFIDSYGREVVPLKFDGCKNFNNGLAQVKWKNPLKTHEDWSQAIEYGFETWGFVDMSGREVIPCKYSEASDFSDGLAQMQFKGRPTICENRGFIDINGQVKIPFIHESVSDFKEGLCLIIRSSKRGFHPELKYGFMDRNGKEVIPAKYIYYNTTNTVRQRQDYLFYDGRALVSTEKGKWGYIGKEGQLIIPCTYDYAFPFSNGLAKVRNGNKWWLVDREGNVASNVNEFWLNGYNMFMAKFNDGIGVGYDYSKKGYDLITINGEVIVGGKYASISPANEGLYRVKLTGKYGYIDKAGNQVIPIMFDDATDFSDGVAEVALNGKKGYIDVAGAEFWENTDEVQISTTNEKKLIVDKSTDVVEDNELEMVDWNFRPTNLAQDPDENPWLDVFGPGDEAETAYWNTE